MKNIKYHFEDFWLAYVCGFIIVCLLSWWIWYEYSYPCIYGHNEEQWQVTYCYGSDGSMWPCGGYFADVFVCDCRTVRDSIK